MRSPRGDRRDCLDVAWLSLSCRTLVVRRRVRVVKAVCRYERCRRVRNGRNMEHEWMTEELEDGVRERGRA